MCVMTHCLPEMTRCSMDSECLAILTCLSGCEPSDAECSFTCGMGGDAGKNEHLTDLLKCMVENECMDKYEESGSCLATDSQALDITDYDMVAGDWWTVWGQSCARFLQVEEEEWVNNTTYCAGSDSICEGEVLVTVPKVYWSSPGVLRHDY